MDADRRDGVTDATADALLVRAETLLAAGPNDEAHALLVAAAARFPDHGPLACRLADSLHLRGRLEDACSEYRRALEMAPDLFEAWYGLGSARLRARSFGAAADALREACARRPDAHGSGAHGADAHGADAHGARANLAEALFQLGDVDAAIALYRGIAAAATPPLAEMALANIACIIPGSPDADDRAILEARRRWSEAAFGGVAPRPRPPRPPGDKLRIGYVSSFFGAANWMKPVFGVINHHDRGRFELHLISLGSDPSAAAGYREHDDDRIWLARGLDNATLAGHVAAAGIDVLVDLNGYTAEARLGLFAHRPAPLQVGWFNMFATTGMTAFDRLIGDDAVIPPAEESFYAEQIDRVPGSYLAFSVLYDVPDVAPAPSVANGHVTFGCLGSAYKITPPTIAAWASILRGAPGSRLFLKNGSLDDASDRAALEARFAREGIGRDRLTLGGRADHFDFLAAYANIDIALDTFPYNGGTTTSEALWQGVPVLTFSGDRWAGRTSRSLLMAAGLDEWVASDASEFVHQAIAIAADPRTPDRLGSLRASLRERLRASAVCDSAGLCRALEDVYLRYAAAPAR